MRFITSASNAPLSFCQSHDSTDQKKVTSSFLEYLLDLKVGNILWPKRLSEFDSITRMDWNAISLTGPLCRLDLAFPHCQCVLHPHHLADLRVWLFRGTQVTIPTKLRLQAIAELHMSHPGIVRMKRLARSRIRWPGVTRN